MTVICFVSFIISIYKFKKCKVCYQFKVLYCYLTRSILSNVIVTITTTIIRSVVL